MDWKALKLPSPKFGENLIGPSFILQETDFSKVTINLAFKRNYLDWPSLPFPYESLILSISRLSKIILFSDFHLFFFYNTPQYGMAPFLHFEE